MGRVGGDLRENFDSWWRFAGELRQLKLSGLAECGAPPLTRFLTEASSSSVIVGRSFVEAIRSTTSVEARVVVFKGCSSRSLDLFPVSSRFELGYDGVGLCSAVDCSTLESVPRYMVAVAGSVSTKKKKKGKFGIIGLMRLLGQFRLKLDRVLAGFALKPIRWRKRVRILGFRNFELGWVFGFVLGVGSSQNLDLGFDLGLNPGLDLDPVLNSFSVKPASVMMSRSVPSSVFNLVFEAVLSPKVSSLIPLSEILQNSSPVKLFLSPV